MAIKRGRRWQVNIRFGAKLLRPTFATEVEARTWELQAKDAREKGLPPPPVVTGGSTSPTTLGVFIDKNFDALWGQNKSSKKYEEYCEQLKKHFGSDKKLTDITTVAVDEWVTSLKEIGNSDKTINRKMAVLSKLLKRARDREIIHKMPLMERRKEGKGRKRFLTEAEEKLLIDDLNKRGEYQAAMRCQFMIYTGARDGEVRSLQWSDISGKRVTLEGKSGHRTIVLPAKAAEAIRWSRKQGFTKPFPMSYTAFKEAWDATAIRLNKHEDPSWVPYVMRHTCASRLVQRQVDIRRVKDWMGHSTITTTMTYAHLAPGDLDACAEALDN